MENKTNTSFSNLIKTEDANALVELERDINFAEAHGIDRRDFLKKLGLATGGLCLLPALLFKPKPAEAGLVAALLWIFTSAVVVAIATEVVALIFDRRGRVGFERTRFRCPGCKIETGVDDSFLGTSTRVHQHNSKCKLSGSYARFGIGAKSVITIGGAAGRQIKRVERAKGAIMNSNIFNSWKDQGIEVINYRPGDQQHTIRIDPHPLGHYRQITGMSHAVARASMCRGVLNREPSGIDISFSRYHPVRIFSDIRNARGSRAQQVYYRGTDYQEVVNTDYIDFQRYRTHAFKQNNFNPGLWGSALLIDGNIHESLGFQWS